jgi:hypothetical protein
MGRSIARLGAGCAGVLAGLALAATPALAQARAGGGSSSASHPAASINPAVMSQFLGGYDVTPAEGISSGGATFKVPAITCPNTGVFQLDLLGVAVNNATGDLYQTGGDTDALSGAMLFCRYGTPTYGIDALTADGAENNDLTGVSPGDTIQTRVEELASGDAVATTIDKTTGQSVTSEAASLGDETQIYEGFIPDVSDETIDSSLSIVKFKPVTFSRSQVGSLSLLQLQPTRVTLAQSGPAMVTASAIKPKTPGRFTLTEKSTQ